MKFPYLLLLLAFIAFFNGCKKDDGPDDRDLFTGSYNVEEYCDSDSTVYYLEIQKSGSGNEVEINGDGLYEAGMVLKALVSGKKLTIPIQRIDLSTTPEVYLEFSGSGSLTDRYLRIDYQVYRVQEDLVISEDNCTAFCYKK